MYRGLSFLGETSLSLEYLSLSLELVARISKSGLLKQSRHLKSSL